MVDFGTNWPGYFEHIEGQGIGIHSLVPNTRGLGANLAWCCLYVCVAHTYIFSEIKDLYKKVYIFPFENEEFSPNGFLFTNHVPIKLGTF